MTAEQFQKILGQLENHEKRIRVLESTALANTSEKKPPKGRQKLSRDKGEDLFPSIQKLFKDGFFKNWQTDLEVCNTLIVNLLTKKRPLRASVVNVLRAMVKKGVLVRDKVQKNKRQVFAYKQT